MNQAVLVNKTRQTSTQSTGSDCNACPTVGLPILPVRYGIVPNTLPGFPLPADCSTPTLTFGEYKKLSLQNSKYVLRTMRAGYLYLYYQSPDSGAWTWQCYMISPNGALKEIPLAGKYPPLPTNVSCANKAHNINSSIISLKKPEKIAKAYIGYSEHFWTPKIRAQYAKSPTPRLIEFSPSEWMKSLKHSHAAKVSDVGKCVIEYSTADLSNGYSFTDASSYLKTSLSEYHSRSGHAAGLVARMDFITAGKGMILALPDPIGCVSDLNSARMHAVDEHQKYIGSSETIWKLSCAVQIGGLRDIIENQTREELKNAKPKYYGRSGVQRISKEEQIRRKTKEGWKRFEEHYSEKKRTDFLNEYKAKCDECKKRITVLDADYVKWVRSESLALTIADYDKTDIISGGLATEVQNRFLTGGVVSDHSLEYWSEMAKLDAADIKNYAVAGILMNQQKWQKEFKKANEKNIGEYLIVDNWPKLLDMAKNAADANGQYPEAAKAWINRLFNDGGKTTAQYLNTVNGALSAVASNLTQKMEQAASGAAQAANNSIKNKIADINRLQLKLGFAFGHLHAATGVALIRIDLSVDEWFQVISSELRGTMQRFSRQSYGTFASMAMDARLRLPANSELGKKVVGFTFLVAGTAQEITQILGGVGATVLATSENAAKGSVHGAGAVAYVGARATHATANAAAEGAKVGLRAIQVVGHNFRNGASALGRIPQQISATQAAQIAARASKHGMTILGSADVKLGALGFALQCIAIKNANLSIQKVVEPKDAEALSAVVSVLSGFTGAALEIIGKSWEAVLKATHPAGVVTLSHRIAARILFVGGIFAAGASAAESIQLGFKSNSLYKKGDNNAGRYTAFAAAAAGVGAFAGALIAFKLTAFAGPVGVVIACIGLGLIFAYLAFFAEDRAIDVWLDRCKFGHADRIEGPFKTLQQEVHALELIGKQLVVEMEWLDNPISGIVKGDTDEIAIVVKRISEKNDAIAIGILVEGPGGIRQVFDEQRGLVDSASRAPSPPHILKAKIADGRIGKNFEASMVNDKSKLENEKNDQTSLIIWEEVVKLNPAKFTQARIWVRYFPDNKNGYAYYEDELLIADDSEALIAENKRNKNAREKLITP